MLLIDQSLKWLDHQFFTVSHVLKNVLLQDEETSVDPQIGFLNGGNVLHEIVLSHRDDVKRLRGTDRQETGYFIMPVKIINIIGQTEIGQSI